MTFFIPKKTLYALVGVAILLAGIVIGLFLEKSADRESGKYAVSKTERFSVSSSSTTTADTDPALFSGQSGQTDLVKVTRVIDGDTIEIEGGERVRYIGIDTPETVDPRKAVQCFGVEASKKNKEMVEGKMVRSEKDITDRDKYGRLLRYVWVGEKMVNRVLVEEGFAYSYSYPPDIKYQEEFAVAERVAREKKLGLWGSCLSSVDSASATLPSFTPAETSASLGADPQCAIKGNIGASGEKIYHLPVCGSYGKTKIDESRGEKWFAPKRKQKPPAGARR